MENFIQDIINLDKKTKEFTEKSEKELEQSKAEIQDMLNNFELVSHEEGKKKAMEMYERVYDQAMEEVEDISKQNQKVLEGVEEVYHKNKEQLVDEAIKLLKL